MDDMWEEMGWDEMRWDEVRRAKMRWDEMWSVKCKCEVWSAGRVWSVKKMFAWQCIAPGPRTGHVLTQQQCNKFAQSTHARTWLAHGACKFYRWKRSYSLTLRQLPPASCGYYWYQKGRNRSIWAQNLQVSSFEIVCGYLGAITETLEAMVHRAEGSNILKRWE